MYLFEVTYCLQAELANTSSESLQRKLDHNGPTWTKVDQSGPTWTNMDQSGPTWPRGTKKVKSSAPADREVGALGPIFSPPPSEEAPLLKMVRSENHFGKIILVFIFIRYDLETFEHLRSSLGLPCNVPSAGSRFASCLYVHT